MSWLIYLILKSDHNLSCFRLVSWLRFGSSKSHWFLMHLRFFMLWYTVNFLAFTALDELRTIEWGIFLAYVTDHSFFCRYQPGPHSLPAVIISSLTLIFFIVFIVLLYFFRRLPLLGTWWFHPCDVLPHFALFTKQTRFVLRVTQERIMMDACISMKSVIKSITKPFVDKDVFSREWPKGGNSNKTY